MLFEKILYFCRKKAASQQSEQAPLRFGLHFFACEGRLFLRVQIDCIMAFYFCIQIVTVRPLGRGINKIIRTMEKTNIYTDEERYWMNRRQNRNIAYTYHPICDLQLGTKRNLRVWKQCSGYASCRCSSCCLQ